MKINHVSYLYMNQQNLINNIKVGSMIVTSQESSQLKEYLISQNHNNLKLMDNLIHFIKGVFLVVNIGHNNIQAINLAKPMKIIPDCMYTHTGRNISLKQIWNHKYNGLILNDHPRLDCHYFIGGPCHLDCGYGLICLMGDNITESQDNLKYIMTTQCGNIFFGKLEDILRRVEKDSSFEKYLLFCFSGMHEFTYEYLNSEFQKQNFGIYENHKFHQSDNYQIWNNIYQSGQVIFAK